MTSELNCRRPQGDGMPKQSSTAPALNWPRDLRRLCPKRRKAVPVPRRPHLPRRLLNADAVTASQIGELRQRKTAATAARARLEGEALSLEEHLASCKGESAAAGAEAEASEREVAAHRQHGGSLRAVDGQGDGARREGRRVQVPCRGGGNAPPLPDQGARRRRHQGTLLREVVDSARVAVNEARLWTRLWTYACSY